MFVLGNVIKPQGLEPLQFPTKFRAPSPLVPIVLCCLKGGLPADNEFRVFDPFVRARYR